MELLTLLFPPAFLAIALAHFVALLSRARISFC